jgi:SAM-dependent methyltransferase
MDSQIIGLQQWLLTPPGQYLLQWERAQLDAAVADVFGYHALQLGWPEVAGLAANRMPHQWLAVSQGEWVTPAAAPQAQPAPAPHTLFRPGAAPQSSLAADLPVPGLPVFDLSTDGSAKANSNSNAAAAVVCDFSALPFAEASLDLLVLPHTLEFSLDPHATLREAARVLVPEGRIVICGLNPTSLWGWRQQRARITAKAGAGSLYLPDAGEMIGYWRLRDWLRLLSFEVESGSFGCYRPAVRSAAWLERMAWMDKLGPRYWPILGAAYCVTAIKRVRGLRVLGPAWKKSPRRATAPVAVAPRAHSHGRSERGGADSLS